MPWVHGFESRTESKLFSCSQNRGRLKGPLEFFRNYATFFQILFQTLSLDFQQEQQRFVSTDGQFQFFRHYATCRSNLKFQFFQ